MEGVTPGDSEAGAASDQSQRSAPGSVSMPPGNGAESAPSESASILGQARNLRLISQLLDMGFDVKASEEALQATGGDSADKAAGWLLGERSTAAAGAAKTGGSEPTKQTTVNQFFAPPPRGKRAASLELEEQGKASLWARRGAESEGRPIKLQRLEPPPAKIPNLEHFGPLKKQAKFTPLAERMRPQSLDEIVGQEHLVGPDAMLRSLILGDSVPSMVFWGPPGSGKTTLARVIAKVVSSRFVQLSAVTAGVKEVREVLEQARNARKLGQRTLLFVDETHRFNKSQQDAFLPAVEAGDVILVGATTENPSFELNAALLSRCRVFTLNKLQPSDIKLVLQRALSDKTRGLQSLESLHRAPKTGPPAEAVPVGKVPFHAEDGALEFLANAADGDARTALNALEMAAGAAHERAQRGGLQRVVSGGGIVEPQPAGLVTPVPAGVASPPSPSGRSARAGVSSIKAAATPTEGAFGSPVEGAEFPWQNWDPEKGPSSPRGGPGGTDLRRKSSLGGKVDASGESAQATPPRPAAAGAPIGDVAVMITLADVSEALQRSHVGYDKTGEEHYNVISALHKSMRGGDANAALYWLARMLKGGEGPLYVARRLVRFASEDVGLADPNALQQAVAAYQACHFIGMPECDVCLAQCVAYLALAPKSVACYRAIQAAQEAVTTTGQNEPVPLHLRNAPTKLMKQLGYGKGYIYPPGQSEPVDQEYMPPSLVGRKFLDWPPGGGTAGPESG